MKFKIFALASILALAACGKENAASSALAQAESTGSAAQPLRDTNMIRVGGISPDGNDSWAEYRDCLPPPRGGCETLVVFAKIYVRPVENANLAQKQVSLGYEFAGVNNAGEKRVVAKYANSIRDSNGTSWEEWHAPIRIRASEPSSTVLRVRGFYSTGAGSEYFDDNAGDMHVLFTNTFGGVGVLENTLWFTGNSVTGKVGLTVADVGYKKDIRLIYTTDAWKTVHEMRVGNPNNENEIYYVSKDSPGWEKWMVNVNVPNITSNRMEFAVVFRYGSSARVYEWWANNGGRNYAINR